MALQEFDYDKEPAVSIAKRILTDAIKMNATDVHFDPHETELVIKFRINGELVIYSKAPENVILNIITRIKILSGMNITVSSIPQYGAINFEYNNRKYNMRTSSLPVINGEKIVVHLSNYAKNLKSLDNLGLRKDDLNKVKEMLKEDNGIILITGTISSGKTTTMYAILQDLGKENLNIISIEDPVKMKIDTINQIQLASDKGITYRSVLRNVLLADPNVIAISELIDDETARSALRASLTGRLVLSTMHTKNALSTIKTLLNMDVENYLLGSNLLGIISQRLVKKLCPTCRAIRKASPYEKKIIKDVTGEDVDELYYPVGCDDCSNGYTDQLPVVEVIKFDDELRSAIANNRKEEFIKKLIYGENDSILKDGFIKVKNGETSFEEVLRIIDYKVDFDEEHQSLKDFILGKTTNIEEDNNLPDENNNDKNEKEDNDIINSDSQKETENESNDSVINEEEKKIALTKNEDNELLKNALKMMEEKIKESKDSEDNENSIIPVNSEENKETTEKDNNDENSSPTSEAYKGLELFKKEEDKENDNSTKEIENKVENEINDDDDDDDDFNYGSSYVNSF